MFFNILGGFFLFACVLSSIKARPLNMNKTLRILNHPYSKNYSIDDFIDSIGDEDIIFPDSVEEHNMPVEIDGVPNCARGDKSFCEHFDGYPHKQINNVLRRANINKNLFGSDEPPDEITNRIGEADEEFVCSSRVKTIFPKVGKTKNNKWKFIVNQGRDGYIQGVNVEICNRPNGPCDLIKDVPYGITTHCRQKYAYRRLVSLGGENLPSLDNFLMPTACCCSYKKDLQFLARFAGMSRVKTQRNPGKSPKTI